MDIGLLTTIVSTSAFSAAAIFALTRLLDWRRRRRQARGYMKGIQLEIAYAQECADEFVSTVGEPKRLPVWTPGFRVITEFTREHLSWLAAEGYLETSETHEVFRFYTRAMEMNRSLDLLATMTGSPDYKAPLLSVGTKPSDVNTRETQETDRAMVKCRNILGRNPKQLPGSSPEAWKAVSNAITRLNRLRSVAG
jgi:hypothetical protein